MEEPFVITTINDDNVWARITTQIENLIFPSDYHFELEQNQRRVLVDFDGNHQQLTFNSIIYNHNDFRFVIHPQGFIDEIGRFFGMQDVILGYKEFDNKFIVKTNREEKTEMLFTDASIRALLESIPGLSLGIVEYITENANGKVPFLELKVDGYITDIPLLKQLYEAFYTILLKVDS